MCVGLNLDFVDRLGDDELLACYRMIDCEAIAQYSEEMVEYLLMLFKALVDNRRESLLESNQLSSTCLRIMMSVDHGSQILERKRKFVAEMY